MVNTDIPLVSHDVLESLEESLQGEVALCHGFVGRYVEMWPQRVSRIHATLTACDWGGAMDAALSLRSSSIMVGAARLGDMADSLVQLLQRGCHTGATSELVALRRCGKQTMAELSGGYLRRSA